MVAVLISMADPTPGVSTSSNPSRRISAGTSTSTVATCNSARSALLLLTNSATSASGTSTRRLRRTAAHHRTRLAAVTDRGDHRGHRERPHRQVGAAEQRVHQRGLAPAELPHDGELEPVGGQPGQQFPGPLLGLLIAGPAGQVQCRPDHVAKFEAAVTVGRQPVHVRVCLRTIRISGIAANWAAMQNTTMAVRDTLNNAPMTMLPATHAVP